MKKICLFSFLLISVLCSAATAQTTSSSCIVIYAEGEGFTHVSGRRSTYYDLFETDVIGKAFRDGDLVITEPDTILELQVSGSNNIIKISENSSFRMESFGERGGGTFSLTYGRIRAKVEKLVGDESFKVDGKSAVCGVRGTDFGYDIISEPAGAADDLVTRIYCFAGSVEVEKKDEAVELPSDTPAEIGRTSATETVTVTAGKRIIITANEMVSIRAQEPELLRSEPLATDIVAFWDINDFRSEPLSLVRIDDIRGNLERKAFEEKKKLFWGNMGLVFAGTALQLVTFFAGQLGAGDTYSSDSPFFPVAVSGGILIGAGAAGLTVMSFKY